MAKNLEGGGRRGRGGGGGGVTHEGHECFASRENRCAAYDSGVIITSHEEHGRREEEGGGLEVRGRGGGEVAGK